MWEEPQRHTERLDSSSHIWLTDASCWLINRKNKYKLIIEDQYNAALMTDSFVCAQSCPALCDPMNCSPPGSPVHAISQARILEWVAIFFSRGSPWPRDWTHVSCIAGWYFTTELSGKSNDTEGIAMVEELENHAPAWWEFWKNIFYSYYFLKSFSFLFTLLFVLSKEYIISF